jgi:hypothetical protein
MEYDHTRRSQDVEIDTFCVFLFLAILLPSISSCSAPHIAVVSASKDNLCFFSLLFITLSSSTAHRILPAGSSFSTPKHYRRRQSRNRQPCMHAFYQQPTNKTRFVCRAGRKGRRRIDKGETLVSIETTTGCAARYAMPKRRMHAVLSEP